MAEKKFKTKPKFTKKRKARWNGRSMQSLWGFFSRFDSAPTDESPEIVVRDDDLDEYDLVFQGIGRKNSGDSAKSRYDRKVWGFFKASPRWRNLSNVQIFLRLVFSKENLGATVSLLIHVAIFLILISLMITSKVGTLGTSTSLSFSTELNDELNLIESAGDATEIESFEETLSNFESVDIENTSEFESNEITDKEFAEEFNLNDGTPVDAEASNPVDDSLGGGVPFFAMKGVTRGRSPANRAKRVNGRDGDVTKESEDAVERGLAWLARHQLPDGGWAFDLTEKDSKGREGSCNGRCSNSFSTSGGVEYRKSLNPSRMAATAIAILPFLGAGYTHTESNKYQQTVAAGLRFLEYHAIVTDDNGVDLRDGFDQDGAAYVQALAVLAFCEAYEMTKDPNLKSLAQGGLKKIEDSQLNDGGWRYYSPGDFNFHANVPGDTSVLGWQMLALKSGVSAGFTVRRSVGYQAGNFLDSVMDKSGSFYRYQPKSIQKKSEMWGTTAVGVLVREYLGWEPGNSQLDAGANQIAKWIDDSDSLWQKAKKGGRTGKINGVTVSYFRDDRLVYNLYFAYYGALALHCYGGKLWENRFAKLRDFLIETQSRGSVLGNSCEDGSWLFYDKYMNDGGRVLNTSLAILILETPYRYLPMYK